MRVHDFLETVGDAAGLHFDGDPGQIFCGFAPPGTQSMPERFLVLLDSSWPYHQRVKAPQNDWSAEQLAGHIRDHEITRLAVPTGMGAEPFGPGRHYMHVDGTYTFLEQAGLRGRSHAAQQGMPVVAVTGSSGKSTVAAMVRSAYRAVRPEDEILSPAAHFNTYIRVLAELSRAPAHDLTVLELSAGGRGAFFNETARRETVLSPEVAVVTSISHAHTRVMKNLSGVVQQKSGILQEAPRGGHAVINYDTLRSRHLRERAVKEGWQLITFGEDPAVDYRLLSYDPGECAVRAATPYGQLHYQVGAEGKHMAYNSLSVLACLQGLGITEVGSALDAFAGFRALPGRGEVTSAQHPQGGEVRLIDETYNANRSSMTAMLETLETRPLGEGPGRRIAVLGDMLMLGEQELKFHTTLLEAAADLDLDHVYLLGDLMGEAYEKVGPLAQISHLSSREQLTACLLQELRGGDVVAFKASHSMQLGEVLSRLVSCWRQDLRPPGPHD